MGVHMASISSGETLSKAIMVVKSKGRGDAQAAAHASETGLEYLS
jgi:hypothetical protein